MKAVTNFHNEIVDTWKKTSSRDFAYFAKFDSAEGLGGFWSEGSRFRQAFDKYLDLSSVLEIASGAGRHASQIANRCDRLTLIDTSVDATVAAKEKFSKLQNVKVVLSGDGLSLPFEPDTFSSVFSYDAMVHFEPLTVAAYISEIARVLIPGGRAVLHHSNYRDNPTGKFTDNPSWRNYMPDGFVLHVAHRAGLAMLEQQAFRWDSRGILGPKTDALTVLELPIRGTHSP